MLSLRPRIGSRGAISTAENRLMGCGNSKRKVSISNTPLRLALGCVKWPGSIPAHNACRDSAHAFQCYDVGFQIASQSLAEVSHVRVSIGHPFSAGRRSPEAIRQMVEAWRRAFASDTAGVTGSGKTFSIANVIAQIQRPTLVLAPNKTLAAQLYGEFKSFFPNNAVEYFVSYYDYYQPEAYVPSSIPLSRRRPINDHIEQMRLSATRRCWSARRHHRHHRVVHLRSWAAGVVF